jgi:hypothetical protein
LFEKTIIELKRFICILINMNKKLRLEENYGYLREQFEETLLDSWYGSDVVDEIYIWREEFVNSEWEEVKENYTY